MKHVIFIDKGKAYPHPSMEPHLEINLAALLIKNTKHDFEAKALRPTLLIRT